MLTERESTALSIVFYIVGNLVLTSLEYQKYFVINRGLFVTFIRLKKIERFVLFVRNVTQSQEATKVVCIEC